MNIDWTIILNIISVCAFLLSVGQLMYALISKRTNLSIFVLEAYSRERIDNIYLQIEISNNSSIDVSINRFIIKSQKSLINKHMIAEKYYTKFPETDIPISERVFTASLPIYLRSYESWIGVIAFPFSEKIVPGKCFIDIITNKGKKREEIMIPEFSDNEKNIING